MLLISRNSKKNMLLIPRQRVRWINTLHENWNTIPKQNPRWAQPVWLIVTRLVRADKEMCQHVVPAGELSEKVVDGLERGGRGGRLALG